MKSALTHFLLPRGRSYLNSRQKRMLDIACALFGLFLFSPLLAVFALAIKAADRGPVLFRQRRLGRLRRAFDITKLRTMQEDKVTGPGRMLRKTGIDEIPQFLDVLRGCMSMAGPRPLTQADVERLGWTGRKHDKRFSTKPGITGCAQLQGGASKQQSYRLDLLYLKQASLALDLRLIFLSFVVNLFGKSRVRRVLSGMRKRRRARYIAAYAKKERARANRLLAPCRAAYKHRLLPRDMRIAPPLKAPKNPGAPKKGLALLLNPFYTKDPNSSFGKHVLTPTLALTGIAAAAPKKWEISYWDENLLQGPPPCDPVPEAVGITVHLTFAKRAYALAQWYRALGSKVILGGMHVISCPEEAAPHADAIAVGDGVRLWPEILNDIERGNLKPVYRASFCGDFYKDPPPEKKILPRRSFLTAASINATRGCRNRCRFCYTSTKGLKMPYRQRRIEDVVREIRQSSEPYAVFTDNNLGADKDYLRELCAALKPLDIIWSAAVSIDVTDDPSLVRKMALSGCTGVFVGFESLSEASLKGTKKKTPPAEDYARRTALFHRNGIQVNGSFVFGFDGDGPDVFARTVEWIEKNRLECATFHILTPYPGTPLFEQINKEGRLLHKNWDLYDTGHVVFKPKQMTVEELMNGYAWTYRRLFSHRSIWKRRPRDLRAVVPYLAMAYLYKRANGLWRLLIKHRLVKTVWSPLIALTRRRHLKFRKRLAARPLLPAPEARTAAEEKLRCETVISAGV
jgi:lipopolysaccharide/colanic/teichoic acid biosynthesis glycosyltransferase/radical SAM superfamily enzyme YgiQ (UPF0313 family)